MSIDNSTLGKIQGQPHFEATAQETEIQPAELEPTLDVDNNLVSSLTGTAIPSFETVAHTPGDEILLSMQRVSEAQGSTVSDINNTITQMSATDSITIADTLKLQKLLIDYQITQDLISKSADKMSQGTQTLFRNQ